MASIALPERSPELSSSTTGLVVAFLLSAAIHLTGASMLGVIPSFSSGSGRDHFADKTLEASEPERDPLQTPDDSDQVRPGSPESNSTSITWIGYDEYSPHAATSGEVDQPQLTFDPPGGPPVESALASAPPIDHPTESNEPNVLDPAPLAEAIGPPSQSPAADSRDVPAPEHTNRPALTDPLGQPDAPQPEVKESRLAEGDGLQSTTPPPAVLVTAPEGPEPSTGIGPLPEELGPEPVFGPVALTPSPTRETPKPDMPVEPAPPDAQAMPILTPPQTPSPPAHAATQVPPAPAPAAPAAPGGDQAGRQADRESDAASVIHVDQAQLGQPLVGKGLEIRTVRPRFSHHTILTAKPSDAVLRVLFDRDGKVTDVEILRSSGVQDVDRPLLDAVFQWRARGEQLKKLRPGTSRETVAMEFRILL